MPRWRANLLEYRIEGRPVLDLTREADRTRLEKILGMVDSIALERPPWWGMESRASILARTRDARIVTDDNMGTEWDLSVERK